MFDSLVPIWVNFVIVCINFLMKLELQNLSLNVRLLGIDDFHEVEEEQPTELIQ